MIFVWCGARGVKLRVDAWLLRWNVRDVRAFVAAGDGAGGARAGQERKQRDGETTHEVRLGRCLRRELASSVATMMTMPVHSHSSGEAKSHRR